MKGGAVPPAATGNQPFKRIERRLIRGDCPTTTADSSRRMSKIRRHGTSAELEVRRQLRAHGVRYTLQNTDLPGSPDIANRRRKIAVFVHGCFWHHHAECPHASVPRRNREFWLAKFARNRLRDRRVAQELTTDGYQVITIWECELKNLAKVANRIQAELKSNARSTGTPNRAYRTS